MHERNYHGKSASGIRGYSYKMLSAANKNTIILPKHAIRFPHPGIYWTAAEVRHQRTGRVQSDSGNFRCLGGRFPLSGRGFAQFGQQFPPLGLRIVSGIFAIWLEDFRHLSGGWLGR